MICDHIGMELTPVLRDLPWAQKANIKTGGDYIRRPGSPAPSASHSSNLPYLFLWGSERAGKSTLHEALSLLVTKGVVKADKALTSNNEFNGELAGAIICAVEEMDITLTPGAYARIKELTTARTIAIRQMRRDVYEVPNTTHWIQTANKAGGVPRRLRRHPHHGDSSRRSARRTTNPQAEDEGAAEGGGPALHVHAVEHAAAAVIDRLRLPMVVTPSKEATIEFNKTSLQRFIEECCQVKKDTLTLRFSEFYDGFQKWLDAGEKHVWYQDQSRAGVAQPAPHRQKPRRKPLRSRPCFQSANGGRAMLIQVHQTIGYVTRSVLQARLVAEVEVDSSPDDPQDFADRARRRLPRKLHPEKRQP